MPKRLYLDTAVSGRMLDNEPETGHSIGLGDPRQPHLVRLAYMGVDDLGPLRAVCHLITPEPEWVWDEDAEGGHGVTYDDARLRGTSLADAMDQLTDALAGADELVMFNDRHHHRVLRRAMIDLGSTFVSNVPRFCAMRMSASFVRKPRHDRRPGFAWPKLTEAYAHFSDGAELPPIDDPIETGLAVVEALRVIREGIERHGGPANMSDEDLTNLIRLLVPMSRTAEVRLPGASFTTGELLTVMREAAAYREQHRSIPR